ncbi:SAM hydroxide adenosyltransferase, partial [Streptomyces sp. NPDC004435]
VPLGQPGITVGSSGTGFAELVVRGGSAAELFGLRQGDRVFHLIS